MLLVVLFCMVGMPTANAQTDTLKLENPPNWPDTVQAGAPDADTSMVFEFKPLDTMETFEYTPDFDRRRFYDRWYSRSYLADVMIIGVHLTTGFVDPYTGNGATYPKSPPNSGLLFEAFPLQKSFGRNDNFAIALGYGISTDYYHSNIGNYRPKTDSVTGTTFFATSDKDIVTWHRLGIAQFQVPLELRANALVAGARAKLAVGAEIGYAYTVAVKTRLNNGEISKRYGSTDLDNVDRLRLALRARVGYGVFAVSGYYGLNSLLTKVAGPAWTPYRLSLALTLSRNQRQAPVMDNDEDEGYERYRRWRRPKPEVNAQPKPNGKPTQVGLHHL